MSLRFSFEARNHITLLCSIVLLCFGYFNSFLVVKAVGIFFQFSSLTGQVLVNKFLTVCDCIFHIFRLTYLFLQVLYEDALVFLKDAVDKLNFVINLLQQFYLLLENFIKGLLQVTDVLSNVLEYLYFTLVTIKEGTQLLGLTIWNFFKVLPEEILFSIIGFNEFLMNTLNELKNSVLKLHHKVIESLEKTYLFFFDIPLNSVYGLIIGAALLTILYVKFKDINFFVSRTFLKLYEQVISFGISLWNGKFLEHKTRRNTSNNFDKDERLCIICQNRLKEIIIFPCKHLCLCGDCSSKLTESRPICPLCRSEITGILKVYL